MTSSHIKSFVRRLGRISDTQKDALRTLWPRYGLEITQVPLDLMSVFNREAPLIIEIGFGMGHALITMAKQMPECNFIGIEVHKPGIGAVLFELEQQQLTNVRVFGIDAVEVLLRCIPDHSVTQFNIYFPDPWQKRRHHKRRLIQPEFVALLHKKLIPGGNVHLATDWQDYAEHMLKVFSAEPGFFNQASEGFFIARPTMRPLTKFEKRGHKLGHQVWDLLFKTKSEA